MKAVEDSIRRRKSPGAAVAAEGVARRPVDKAAAVAKKTTAAPKKGQPTGKKAAGKTTASAPATPLPVRAVDGRAGVSLVQQAVDALRRAVLEAPGPDVFLGSEEQLIAALGVSRPTFRQAAKLLRHENLLTIKRGMGGGFFTRSPSADAVSRMAAIFLNAQGTGMRQINDVVGPLQAEAARLVANNPDRAVRSRLTEFIAEQLKEDHLAASATRPVRSMLGFERLLAEISGNPAISLVINVMLDLVRDARRVQPLQRPDLIASYGQFQSRLAQAVLEGDAEMAVLICNRHAEEVRRWMPEGKLELSMGERADG